MHFMVEKGEATNDQNDGGLGGAIEQSKLNHNRRKNKLKRIRKVWKQIKAKRYE